MQVHYLIALVVFLFGSIVSAFGQTISSGQDIQGQLSAANRSDTYSFEATSGQAIRLGMGIFSGVADPQIVLRSPTGAVIRTATGSSQGGANIVETATTSGTYSVSVSDFADDESGSYHLSLVVAGAPQVSGNGNFINVTSGQDFQGDFIQGDFDVITIQATAGASIRAGLGVLTGTADPFIEIFSPSGQSLDTDSGSSAGGANVVATAPTTGIYTIALSDAFKDEAGTYHASVVVGAASSAQSTNDDNFVNVTSGQDFQGAFAKGDLDVITIQATAGASIRAGLGVLTGAADPFIEIFSPTGQSLDTDSGSSAGGANVVATAPTTGIYTIALSDAFKDEAGTYHATVIVGAESSAQSLSDDNFVNVTSGQDFQGALVKGDLDVITVQATAGASIRAGLGILTGTADPFIEIFSPTGQSLDTDSGSSAGGANVVATAPTTGIYTIALSDAFKDEAGTYHASVVVGAESSAQSTNDDNFVNVTSGQDFQGALAKGDFDVITIQATAGASIRAGLGILTGTADPFIEIFSPSGESLDTDSGSSAGGANVVATAPTTGTYTIALSDAFKDEAGTYHASVVVGAASSSQSLNDDNFIDVTSGQDFQGALSRGDFDVITIQATAGASIRAGLGILTGSADPFVEIFSPAGQSLGTDSGSSGGGANVVATAPTTGIYTIALSDAFKDEAGTYHASVVVGAASSSQSLNDDNFIDVTSGEDFQGAFSKGDFDVITIQAGAGATIYASLGVLTGTADPFIEIFSPSGDSLDVDSGSSAGGANVMVTAPASGIYTIALSDSFKDEAGTYHASVAVGGVNRIEEQDNTPLSRSSPATGFLNRGDLNVHSFGGRVNDQLTLSVTSSSGGGFRPFAVLLAPSGQQLLIANNSQRTITLAESGNYLVIVGESSSDQQGDYQLTVGGFSGQNTIAFVDTVRIPQINFTKLSANALEIWWADPQNEWELQTSNSLEESSFISVSSTLVGNRRQITINELSNREFFRLIKSD